MLNLEIPAGYMVDEMPTSAKVKLGEADGFFEYLIDQYNGTIRLRSRIKLNRATFAPQEYNTLRAFFSYVVKKHAESIVLKRKAE